MHTLTLSQLAGISPQELQRVDDMLEKLVRERNAEKIVEIVKEYVKRNVRVLADKRYDRYLRGTVMRLFTEKFIVLVFTTKYGIEVHVFKKTTITPDGLRIDGVKVLKEIIPRK